jgi:hypothetical protein
MAMLNNFSSSNVKKGVVKKVIPPQSQQMRNS